ncbi:hypothetical protein MB02_03070 [Croceicoccus estronivorus]|uniref:nuclear transport factor 2 family protein n=1 Tax=Croceicoccus estronivorus TaxID=1172626 RepID=UPI000837077B|nr:nuclear transport factor 2 family protein [Croceicoccus estronivorus]OCC25622.1 hypothetical protein MB02_03070 [Croceicoccus estronivorus]
MKADDYFAIQNLINSYPYLLDRGDFDAVGQLFKHADVISGGTLMASKSAEAVAEAFRSWVITYEDGTPRTRHCLANLCIIPEGEDRALVKSYVMVFQQTDAVPLQPVIGGDYADRVQKVDGEWRIIERQMGNNQFGHLEGHGRDLGIFNSLSVN